MNASSLASLPADKRLLFLNSLTDLEAAILLHDWSFWARDAQAAPPGDWRVWLLLAGRGFGKTRAGAEWVREQARDGARRIALVAPTSADARDTMIEGESGLLAISPDWERPMWEPSKRRLTWTNGAIATAYSADEPDRLRGPQHDAAWCDEVAAWRYPEAWDMLQLGLRLGADPRCVVTTTPRPTPLVRMLVGRSDCAISRGSSYDNAANLAPAFLEQIVRRYEGTRIGRQEIHAELLEDVPGALWQQAQLDTLRTEIVPALQRIVVAVDPPTTSGPTANECGIIVAGVSDARRVYVLADRSLAGSPHEWARQAVAAYHTHGADRLVAEVNQGGDMIEALVRQVDPDLAYKAVHARHGKKVRAEPVAALYEQNRVFHAGRFSALEDQMCAFSTAAGWTGSGSPDRVDALVWAISDLLPNRGAGPAMRCL
ncbi:MAG: DNA-packaging protein [Alphaproteobacteria bacterium]